jgi:hypothetical protein
LKVRSQIFSGATPAQAWAVACEFARARLQEGFNTMLIIAHGSILAKKYGVPAGTVMVRYWGKPIRR